MSLGEDGEGDRKKSGDGGAAAGGAEQEVSGASTTPKGTGVQDKRVLEYLGDSYDRQVHFSIDMMAVLSGRAIKEVAADREQADEEEMAKILQRVEKQGSTESAKGTRLTGREAWLQSLLEDTLLQELIEAATPGPGEGQKDTRADDLKKRRQLAEQAL